MTTLITIPTVTALHLPTPSSTRIPLSTGPLTLTLLPADPPTTPNPSITLSVGTVSFPLSAYTPISHFSTLGQQPEYVFTPAVTVTPSAAPTSILPTTTTTTTATSIGEVGQIILTIPDSKSPEALEQATALSASFETILKSQKLWHDKTFYETAEQGIAGGISSTTISNAFSSIGSLIASKITSLTSSHIAANPTPTHPPPPSAATADNARRLSESTASLAQYTSTAASKISAAVHDGAKYVGERAKEFQAGDQGGHRGGTAEEAAAGQKGVGEEGVWNQVKTGAGEVWDDVKLVAKGAGQGATEVGSSISTNQHRIIAHDLGPQADAVAKDLGQAGSNVASSVVDATLATSVIKQGGGATTGAKAGYSAV